MSVLPRQADYMLYYIPYIHKHRQARKRNMNRLSYAKQTHTHTYKHTGALAFARILSSRRAPGAHASPRRVLHCKRLMGKFIDKHPIPNQMCGNSNDVSKARVAGTFRTHTPTHIRMNTHSQTHTHTKACCNIHVHTNMCINIHTFK